MRRPVGCFLLLAAGASAALAEPPVVPDFGFAGGDTRCAVPMTATGDAFLIEVMIGGRGPYPFALDTGGADTLDAGLAEELGLAVEGTDVVLGAGETPIAASVVRVPSLAIGELELRDQQFRVVPLVSASPDYTPPYRGLIGHELFERLVVRIEPDTGRVVFSDPRGWSYEGPGVPAHLDFHGHIPMVTGAIDGVTGRFMLDTGQANSVTLFRPFLNHQRLEGRWPARFTATVSWGLGGSVVAGVSRGNLLTLGPVSVDQPILYLSMQQSGAFSDDQVAGNIGEGVFARFDVTFDYHGQRAWFERSATYGIGDSMHIMTLKRSFLGYTVLGVLPGGAAALAGLRPGDEIEYVQYRDATHIEPIDLEQAFRYRPGTVLTLGVRSHGERKHVNIVLRPTI